jgi:hypothetical protein
MNKGNRGPAPHIRASKVCFSALSLLLLLSACGIIILPRWKTITDIKNFLRYYNIRVALREEVRTAIANPLWKKVEERAGGPEKLKNWRLSAIESDYEYLLNPRPTKFEVAPIIAEEKPIEELSKSAPGQPILPPTFATLLVSMPQAIFPRVPALLRMLHESQTLENAKALNNRYHASIARYRQRIDELESFETKESGEKVVRSFSKEPMLDALKSFTLGELETLANDEFFELDTIERDITVGAVSVPWIEEKASVISIVPLLAASICLLQGYYYGWVKYLYALSAFPPEVTFLAVANHDWMNKALFLLTIALPSILLLTLSASAYSEMVESKVLYALTALEIILTILSAKHSLWSKTARREANQ